jgi:hypothetical protein
METRGCGRRKAADDVQTRVMGEDGKETKNGRRRWWMDVERRNIWRRIDNDMYCRLCLLYAQKRGF